MNIILLCISAFSFGVAFGISISHYINYTVRKAMLNHINYLEEEIKKLH